LPQGELDAHAAQSAGDELRLDRQQRSADCDPDFAFVCGMVVLPEDRSRLAHADVNRRKLSTAMQSAKLTAISTCAG
jgi:hypothetical protein